jgi:indoleamine 2,3-dioxygenase
LDERWFYLISVAFEAKGAPVIPLMLDAIIAARASDVVKVTVSLKIFAQHLEDLILILNRMYQNCDPKVFYHQIRLFLAGSKSMEQLGLRNCLVYDDGTDKEEDCRVYAGGSNAQSSLIQFFDIVLGISHTSNSNQSFITDMRAYMPGKHRRFLERVMEITNIRTFVEERGDHQDLMSAYNTCVELMCSMRNVHLRMVARYIITQSRSEDVQRNYSGANGGSTASLRPPKKTMRGTGGTDLMPFLSQIRNETSQSKIRSLASGSRGNILQPIKKQDALASTSREAENSNHGGQKFAAPVWLPLWIAEWRGLHYVLVLTASMATFLLVLV